MRVETEAGGEASGEMAEAEEVRAAGVAGGDGDRRMTLVVEKEVGGGASGWAEETGACGEVDVEAEVEVYESCCTLQGCAAWEGTNEDGDEDGREIRDGCIQESTGVAMK